MQIPKQKIIDLLRERGETEEAARAEFLPDHVDSENHADWLKHRGIQLDDLTTSDG